MSSSSLSPSRHKKTSSNSRRCDYGENHVSRDRYEERKDEVRGLRLQLEEKADELLRYHNELGETKAQLEDLETTLDDAKKKFLEKEKELEEHVDDYNEVVEERDKSFEDFNKLRDDYHQAKRDLENAKRESSSHLAKIEALQKEATELRTQTLKRGRSPGPERLAEEVKRLQKESQDLRQRLTIVWKNSQQEETIPTQHLEALSRLGEDLVRKQARIEEQERIAEDLREELRHSKLNTFFTPEPQSEELEALRKDVARWKEDFNAAADRENDVTEKLVLCADQILRWEKATTQLDHGNTISPERAHNLIRELRERADLTPLRNLHPALLKLSTINPQSLAVALSDALTWELTELWQLLPHPPEESLVTPDSKLGDLLARLKRAAQGLEKGSRKDLKATRERLKDAQAQIEDLKRTAEVNWHLVNPDPANIQDHQQLRQWIAALKRHEVHGDGLVVANQAVIFEWENTVGLALCEDRELTPQKAGERLDQLFDLKERLERLAETLLNALLQNGPTTA